MSRSVLEFAYEVADSHCNVVLKVLQGSEFPVFMKEARSLFRECHIMKPKASRKESSEVYCVFRDFVNCAVCGSPHSHSTFNVMHIIHIK